MDKKMNELPLWYKVASATAAGALAGCAVTGGISPTISSEQGGNNPNTLEINPTSTKTDFERAQETLNSFVTEHPEYKDREATVINFAINGISANTVVMEANKEESDQINSFDYEFNGVKLQPYDKAVVFTLRTDFDGKTEWVRLAGVWFPTEDDSVNTAWYYSPDAFDKEKTTIDFKQRVFGFNSRDNEYVFWPLVEPPIKLLWNDDLTSNKAEDYEPWNGNDPFTLPVSVIPVGAGKALFAPVPVETSPESLLPQEVKEKFDMAGIDMTDMQNAKYDKDGLHITLESGEVIVLTNTDLQKGMYNGQDNVLQYRDETNQNVIYAFDKATGKWEVEVMGTSLSIENLDAKKWGNYSLIENPDGYYEMKDVQGNLIPEVKLFRDGTAELTYSSKKLAVAFQAISVGAEGQLSLGLWDYQNGEWSMAPGYTAEDVRAGEFADDYHKLVVIRGNDEIQKKLTDTIFMARDLYMNNTEGYRPESEFEGITVVTLNGKTIENFDGPAKGWMLLWGSEGVHEAGIFYFKHDLKNKDVSTQSNTRESDARPLQVALGIGYFPVTIIYPKYGQEMSVLHVPVVAKEPNKILNLSALVNISDLPRLNPYMENKEVRGKLFIWIVKATQPHLHQDLIADPVLLGFVGETNRSFFSSMPVLPSISFAPKYNSLPNELKFVFFTLLE